MNKAERIASCIEALLQQRLDRRTSRMGIVVLANNCADGTAAVIRVRFPQTAIDVREVSLPWPYNHAGWARRLSIEAAVQTLTAPTDVLLCTDADTVVAPDWVARNLSHIDAGFDAVAGFAMPLIAEWRSLHPAHRARFNCLRKYYTLLAYLRRERHGLAPDPWPRHEYEGGASIAMTLGLYRRLGDLPTPAVGEDKALFRAIERAGGRLRHPLDVRVVSGRMASPR